MNDTTQASPATQAFNARKAMHSNLLESQASEHEFYQRTAKQVETGAIQLAEFFSTLIQDEMPTWTGDQRNRFAQLSSVPSTWVDGWCRKSTEFSFALVAGERAKAALALAKDHRRQYAGVLWGAKKGLESQFEEASRAVDLKESEERATAEDVRRCGKEAKSAATDLLNLCVQNAARIAESGVVGQRPQIILDKLGEVAEAALAQHRHTQMQVIRNMKAQLAQLESIYGEMKWIS